MVPICFRVSWLNENNKFANMYICTYIFKRGSERIKNVENKPLVLTVLSEFLMSFECVFHAYSISMPINMKESLGFGITGNELRRAVGLDSYECMN